MIEVRGERTGTGAVEAASLMVNVTEVFIVNVIEV
jgi:hypothetical protein